MEEPDINIDRKNADEPVRKSSKLKYILILIAILAVVLGGGIFYLKSTYNEEFLKSVCEQQISQATGGECKIEHVEWSLSGKIGVRGLTLAFAQQSRLEHPEFLQLDVLTADIDYLQSVLKLQPVVRLNIDGIMLRVVRILNTASNTAAAAESDLLQDITLDKDVPGKEKFSTNIHNLLAAIAELPLKKWIEEFKWWKSADAEVAIKNVVVNVHDQSGQLQDMNFELNLAARLQKTGLKFDLDVKQHTPEVPQGGITVAANVLFDWDAAAKRPDKPLAFIGSTNISLKIDELDTGYLGRYYLQSEEQLVRLAQPLSGYLLVSAEDLSKVNFLFNLNSKKIVEFVRGEKILEGGDPSLEFSLKAEVDMSREWSNIRSGAVDILCSNAQTGAKLLKISSQIFGSFGDEVVVNTQSVLDTGAIARSALGRAFDLYNIAQGELELGSALTWKKDADWGYTLNLQSDNLVIKNGSSSVPAPLAMQVNGSVRPMAQFTPESTSFQLKCTAPGIVLNTTGEEGITVPLDSNRITFAGGAKAEVNMPEVFRAFAAPLGKLGMKPISEQLAFDIRVTQSKSIQAQLELKNTLEQYAPCQVNLVVTPDDAGGFKGSFDLTAEKKAVQVKALIDGLKKPDGTMDLNFSKQYALRIGSGINLLKRIQNIIPGLDVAQYPVAGVMRGSVRGRGVINGDNISLAASNTTLLENISFTTDSGRKFTDAKTQIDASFSLQDVLGSKTLSLSNFSVAGDTAEVSCKTDSVQLQAFSESLLAGLQSIKGLKAGIKFGANTFANIYALTGDMLPPFVKTGKSLDIAVESGDNGDIALQRLDINSTGLVAAVTGLVLNPGKLIPAAEAADFAAVIAGLSPFKINVKAARDFWSGISLPEGLNFSGDAELAVEFEPEKDRLTLSRLILSGDWENKAFISRMSAALVMDNVSRIAAEPTLPLLLESLPKGVNIPVLTVSLPRLKEFMQSNGATLPLTGDNLELSRLRLIKAKQQNTLQLAGNIISSGLSMGESLTYKGNTSLNNLITIDTDSFAVTGELNFKDAAIMLKALPYVYNKSAAEPAKLYYKFDGSSSGKYIVSRAGITGGPLQFDLSNLNYEVLAGNRFKLSLPQFKLLAPVAVTAADIAVDPQKDLVRANVAVAKIDLDKLSSSLDTGLPSTLGGYIGAIRIAVDDKYSTLIEDSGKVVAAGNRLLVDPSSVTLTSTRDSSVKMTIGVGKIQGDTAKGKFTIGGLSITSPTGFSDPTPLEVGQIDSVLDLAAMAQGHNIVTEVIISSFKAIYELKLPNNNIAALQKNIDMLLPASSAAQSPQAASPSSAAPAAGVVDNNAAAAADKGVLIRDLYLNNGTVAIKSQLVNTSVAIPQTHVRDIGGDNPRVAFTTILNVLLRSIGKASLSILDNTAGTAVKSVTNILGNALQNKDKSGNEADAADSQESTVKSVSNLLGSVLNDSSSSDTQSGTSEKKSNPLSNLFK